MALAQQRAVRQKPAGMDECARAMAAAGASAAAGALPERSAIRGGGGIRGGEGNGHAGRAAQEGGKGRGAASVAGAPAAANLHR